MIDNYDSFTYNLVQYFGELGEEVRVVRNDHLTVEEIAADPPQHLVVSPGPCTPNEAGISMAIIRAFSGKIPLLGVCLGHQCIGQAFGGKVVRARQVMHGKTSLIHHQEQGLYKNIANPFLATRYHSLVVEKTSLPACLQITAWTEHASGELDEIMGLQHRILPVVGVQFHPESILTAQGHDLLKNFLGR